MLFRSGRQVAGATDLDAAEIGEPVLTVGVEADAVGDGADLAGDGADEGGEAPPLRQDRLAVVVKVAKQLVMAQGKHAKSLEVQVIRCLLAMLGRLERRDDPEYKSITWDKD